MNCPLKKRSGLNNNVSRDNESGVDAVGVDDVGSDTCLSFYITRFLENTYDAKAVTC